MPESWQDVMKDIGDKIMPGMTHWQSPNFHAYYPTATSYPSIVGEIIASGFGVVGFSWVSSIQEKNLFQYMHSKNRFFNLLFFLFFFVFRFVAQHALSLR